MGCARDWGRGIPCVVADAVAEWVDACVDGRDADGMAGTDWEEVDAESDARYAPDLAGVPESKGGWWTSGLGV